MYTLNELGWTAALQERLDESFDTSLHAARVAGESHDTFDLLTPEGPARARLTGRLRDAGWLARPAVGDWVLWRPGDAVVVAVLPRHALFARKAAGRTSRPQVMAANVDRVLVVTALGRDFNPRRVERYLAAAWAGGATPVVVVNKADLPPPPAAMARAMEEATQGVATVQASALDGQGMEALRHHLPSGATAVLVGSSGVGKSTLVNRLVEGHLQEVGAVRAGDGKGRHTTTRRDLIRLPWGAWLIDTPGLREVGLVDVRSGLARVFSDLEALADECRFRDCAHAGEPGCAVQAAVVEGLVPKARADSWLRLRAEAEAEAQRQEARAGQNAKKRWKEVHMEVRRRRRLHRSLGLKE